MKNSDKKLMLQITSLSQNQTTHYAFVIKILKKNI